MEQIISVIKLQEFIIIYLFYYLLFMEELLNPNANRCPCHSQVDFLYCSAIAAQNNTL